MVEPVVGAAVVVVVVGADVNDGGKNGGAVVAPLQLCGVV